MKAHPFSRFSQTYFLFPLRAGGLGGGGLKGKRAAMAEVSKVSRKYAGEAKRAKNPPKAEIYYTRVRAEKKRISLQWDVVD